MPPRLSSSISQVYSELMVSDLRDRLAEGVAKVEQQRKVDAVLDKINEIGQLEIEGERCDRAVAHVEVAKCRYEIAQARKKHAGDKEALALIADLERQVLDARALLRQHEGK
jgi:hypothetical protein